MIELEFSESFALMLPNSLLISVSTLMAVAATPPISRSKNHLRCVQVNTWTARPYA